VREAIEGRRWAEAQEFIARTAAAIDAARAKIEAATPIPIFVTGANAPH
jgi:hypothetical protein